MMKAIGPAEISRRLTENGCDVSVQMMGNWKTRGVPYKVRDDVCRIFRVTKAWLDSGSEPMRVIINGTNDDSDPSVALLIDAFKSLPPLEQRRALIDLQYRAAIANLEASAVAPPSPKPQRTA